MLQSSSLRRATTVCTFSLAAAAALYAFQNNASAPAQAQANRTPPARQQLAAAGPKGPAAVDPAVAAQGQRIFSSNCAFCHGANAKGGESGPDLLRSENVLDDDNGNKIGPIIHGALADKGMPKFPLSDEQIAQISAFLHSRIQAAAERGTYQILNIVTGDPKKGEAYFRSAGCNSCHSLDKDLAHIGSKMEPVAIQQAIVMPRNGRGIPGWAPVKRSQQLSATITLASGEKVQGFVQQMDDFSIEIQDTDGNIRSFDRNGDSPKIELHDPIQWHTDMLVKWQDSDIHNLTAYLVSQK